MVVQIVGGPVRLGNDEECAEIVSLRQISGRGPKIPNNGGLPAA
jgi:hypothetical protein